MSGNQACAVPQGDRQKRARPESEDVTDQPAATHIRVEEARQPQWTMNSTVEDILLKGSTNRADMKLNDFFRSNLGGRAAVDEDYNVTMQVFVQDPEMFIQNEILLRIITALPSYQALEATYKLHHEGVFFLEQWKDYEGKDTVTPAARGNLNGALTQILTERIEVNERVSREAEERAVREKQVGFTLTTTIRGVLFRGRVRVMNIKLNDFLLLEFGGKGIVATKENVLLEE
ncbi:retrotransposon hot spot (RHS) protein, putative, partial [Trypanosoma cruzi]